MNLDHEGATTARFGTETTEHGQGRQGQEEAFLCGRKVHASADCRTGRVCYNCHKPGHSMKQCTLPKRSVQELEAELVEEPEEEEEHLMFMLEFLKAPREEDELRVGSTLQIAVDSGSEVHAMPYKLVKHFVEEMKSDTMMLLRGAGREELKYYGRLRVTLKIGRKS